MDISSTAILIEKGPATEASYVAGKTRDLDLARRLYKKYRTVKIYNNWVMIGGIAINGISKKEMDQIEREINQEDKATIN